MADNVKNELARPDKSTPAFFNFKNGIRFHNGRHIIKVLDATGTFRLGVSTLGGPDIMRYKSNLPVTEYIFNDNNEFHFRFALADHYNVLPNTLTNTEFTIETDMYGDYTEPTTIEFFKHPDTMGITKISIELINDDNDTIKNGLLPYIRYKRVSGQLEQWSLISWNHKETLSEPVTTMQLQFRIPFPSPNHTYTFPLYNQTGKPITIVIKYS